MTRSARLQGTRAEPAARPAPVGVREHEVEAAPGLPEPLPASERLLWQGGPDWRRLAVEAFHVRKVAVYFAAILLARGGFVLADGGGALKALVAMLWLTPLVAFALGTLLALAWMTGRTTIYTITSRRVVMRIGIVLTVTFNLPFRHIASAGLRLARDGRGDIPLQLAAGDRIGFLHLWPHVRPWKIARPQPMLRALPDAQRVAELLTAAWRAAASSANAGAAASRATPPAARPTAPRSAPTLAEPLPAAE
jgi:hypothetical protein